MNGMKKLVFGLITLISLSNLCGAASFKENSNLYLVDERRYITICIEGTKWVQFLQRGETADINKPKYYPSGNPVQIFVKANGQSISIPLECEENQK